MKLKGVAIIVTAVIVTAAFSSVAIYDNVTQKVMSPVVDPNALNYKNYFIIPYGYTAAGERYNYTSTGYLNLSSPNCAQTYRYFFEAFRWPQIYVVNSSNIGILEGGAVNFWLVLANYSTNWPFDAVSLKVTDLSLSDSAISSNMVPVFSVFNRSSVNIYTQQYMNASVHITGGWLLTDELLQVGGIHFFTFQLSLTPFSDVGPFKFAGTSVHISLEWNATVVQ